MSHLKQILQERLSASHVEVNDETARHAGHASEADHFSVMIVADQFTGKSLVERHRAVYDALQAEMKTAIHALKIKALSPSEWTGQ